jgi:hypothetical protein
MPERGGRVTHQPTVPVPTALVPGSRSLWVLSGPSGFVDRFDLRSGRRTTVPFELPEVGAEGLRTAATPGALWLAAPGARGRLTRVTPPG